MAARAYWKGHVRLSLVRFPVQLHSASRTSGRISFHQLHRTSESRIRYQKVVPGLGEVDNDEIVKGFEVAKDRYVTISESELEGIRVDSKRTIDLVQFVDAHEIDPLYYEKPYFVVSDGALAQDAYRVIRQALSDTKKVAIGQIVLSGRESLIALQACGRGLLLETLRSRDELKKGSTFFAEVEDGPIDDEQLAMARELVQRKTGRFDPSRFVDHYEAALRELIASKTGGSIVRAPAPARSGSKIVDLMDALKKNLAGEGPRRRAGASAEIRDHPAKLAGQRRPAAKPKPETVSRGQPSRRKSA